MEEIVARIAQIDVQKSGPIPDDAKEAYYRGIEAALRTLGVVDGGNYDRLRA